MVTATLWLSNNETQREIRLCLEDLEPFFFFAPAYRNAVADIQAVAAVVASYI